MLHIKDYATAPMTGSTTGDGQRRLARAHQHAARGAGRRRPLLRQRPQRPAVHPRQEDARRSRPTWTSTAATIGPGSSTSCRSRPATPTGSSAFQFDPDYRRNGKFYTIHLEEPAAPGSTMPDATSVPGLKLAGYTPTPPITTPGAIEREAVVIEWTDSNISNTTFEGTARELMRVQLNTRIHPMGDLIFNPTARPGDADWRVLYIGVRRRRLRRAAHGDAAEPAAPRHAGRKDSAHRARSRAAHRRRARSARTAATAFRATTRSRRRPARGRRSGPTASAIRTA